MNVSLYFRPCPMLYPEFKSYLEGLPNPGKVNVIVSRFNEYFRYSEEDGPQPTFDLRVEYDHKGEEVKERFKVEIRRVVEYNLEDFFITDMQFTREHPVLWAYNDLHGSLYFSGTIAEPEKAWEELQEAHEQLFRGLKPLAGYINRGKAGLEVLRAHSGLLANGPIGLLEVYAGVFHGHAVRTSIIGGGVRTFWDGDADVPYESLDMLILNRTYVVGQEFNFEKVAY